MDKAAILKHYQGLAEEAQALRAAGEIGPKSEPVSVPEVVTVAGGHAVVVDGKVVDVIRYNDAWGDGK